jgi:hypothetical protein
MKKFLYSNADQKTHWAGKIREAKLNELTRNFAHDIEALFPDINRAVISFSIFAKGHRDLKDPLTRMVIAGDTMTQKKVLAFLDIFNPITREGKQKEYKKIPE